MLIKFGSNPCKSNGSMCTIIASHGEWKELPSFQQYWILLNVMLSNCSVIIFENWGPLKTKRDVGTL